MAATALRELIPIECYQNNLRELTDLITHHSPRFRRIALAQLGNVADAEDAVQDAVLAAFKHVDQFRNHAKISTWLTAIVINSARMKLRRRATELRVVCDNTSREQKFSLADFVVDTRPGPEEAYRNQEIAKVLANATSRLSPAVLSTFQLRDIHGLSIRQTASLLGVPSGTVKARTARARKKLKALMQQALSPASSNQRG